jgi:hypothetical protein
MTIHDPGPSLGLPDWVPDAARHYLSHTESGHSIRALARARGVHASTILRQVRKIEMRRDDPLVDAAIQALAQAGAGCDAQAPDGPSKGDERTMTGAKRQHSQAEEGDETEREGLRILRRLQEPGAVLAVAPDMEKAVVVRDTAEGRTVRIAALDRPVAEAMALRDWIEPLAATGRIRRYRISAGGLAALRRGAESGQGGRQGFAEAQGTFAARQSGSADRDGSPSEAGETRRRVMVRYNAAESPVVALSRRREKDGTQFLADELVASAERLREDFELAQLGPPVAQNWERVLTGAVDGGVSGAIPSHGPLAARARVGAALKELGPGLGDIALRCCCYLEGLETAERRLGWSSRSAKIVLRIALQRLKRHYEETGGLYGVLIG